MKYMNGNPRSKRLMHYETGCCTSERAAKDGVFAAIVQGGLLGGFSQTTPSKARWGSTTEALGEQAAGVMIHNILPQAFKMAFPKYETMGGCDDEHSEDYRRYLRAKTFRATKVLNDDMKMMTYAARSWFAEPIDYLWMRLQWLDGRPSGMMDLQHERLNPFAKCQGDFAEYLLTPIMSGHMRAVCSHFVSEEEHALAFVSLVRREVLSMVCQIYWRFELVFGGWPYRLTLLADDRHADTVPPHVGDEPSSTGRAPKAPGEERRGLSQKKVEVFTALWNEPDCCIDQGFSAKVRIM